MQNEAPHELSAAHQKLMEACQEESQAFRDSALICSVDRRLEFRFSWELRNAITRFISELSRSDGALRELERCASLPKALTDEGSEFTEAHAAARIELARLFPEHIQPSLQPPVAAGRARTPDWIDQRPGYLKTIVRTDQPSTYFEFNRLVESARDLHKYWQQLDGRDEAPTDQRFKKQHRKPIGARIAKRRRDQIDSVLQRFRDAARAAWNEVKRCEAQGCELLLLLRNDSEEPFQIPDSDVLKAISDAANHMVAWVRNSLGEQRRTSTEDAFAQSRQRQASEDRRAPKIVACYDAVIALLCLADSVANSHELLLKDVTPLLHLQDSYRGRSARCRTFQEWKTECGESFVGVAIEYAEAVCHAIAPDRSILYTDERTDEENMTADDDPPKAFTSTEVRERLPSLRLPREALLQELERELISAQRYENAEARDRFRIAEDACDAFGVRIRRYSTWKASERERKMGDCCKHSPTFTSVLWHGEEYEFNPTQAYVVRELFEAHKSGTPTRTKNELLNAIPVEARGSGATELCHIFRGHPAWKAMIVSPKKGVYRLSEIHEKHS